MNWLHLILSWQVLLLVGVGQKASAAKVPLGCTDAPSSRRQRGTKVGPSAAASEHDEVTSSPVKDYWFKTGVEDAERGFMQGRAETKRGDQVVGSYQYSDGNVKVKVVYAADDQGYRVLKEERVTLKPFTKSEVPNEKPAAAQKKPKGKPRRPSGHKQRPKPNVYKHPKIKPNIPRYHPDVFQGNSPSVFPGSSGGTFSGNNPNMYPGNSPNIFSGNNPDVFSSNGPDVLSANSPGMFHGNNPDVFSGNKPDIFSGNKPDLISGKKPDSFPGKKPDSFPENPVETAAPKKPESTEGKFSSSYSGGSQGLQLPSLEGLDGYSVKLRTNHGSGYSLQGFSSSPGKSQKVRISKSGKSTPVDESDSGNPPYASNKNPSISDDDQFNHSLESHDDFPRPNGNSGRPMRETRPKPKGRKRRPKIGHTDHLAIFVKEPTIDPKVVLFKPHPPLASQTKNPKRSPFFRPAEGLRL